MNKADEKEFEALIPIVLAIVDLMRERETIERQIRSAVDSDLDSCP